MKATAVVAHIVGETVVQHAKMYAEAMLIGHHHVKDQLVIAFA